MSTDDLDDEIKRQREERRRQAGDLVGLASSGGYDDDLYGGSSSGFSRSIPLNEDDDEDTGRRLPSYTAPDSLREELAYGEGDEEEDPFKDTRRKKIVDREDEYHRRRQNRDLSPGHRSYKEKMAEQLVVQEEQELQKKLALKKEDDKKREREDREKDKKKRKREDDDEGRSSSSSKRKKSEWDDDGDRKPSSSSSSNRWDQTPSSESQPRSNRWDQTPQGPATGTKSRWDQTPVANTGTRNRWDETPQGGAETPSRKGKSRWDETPVNVNAGMMTPGATPLGFTGAETPSFSQMRGYTPEQMISMRYEKDIEERNRPLSDEELNDLLPADGYEVMVPPASYQPIRTPARKLTATPTPAQMGGFMMQDDVKPSDYGVSTLKTPEGLPEMKVEDEPFFGKLLDGKDEASLSTEEIKERKIMKLLLKVKNGTPAQRKQSLRMLTDKAREFGPGPLFNQILPLLMSPALEDQERHLLVKVIDRVLYKLDDLVRPYVHKILVVIEPLLIDEDYYARVEGREIISNLAKAAGLATMIAVMRPDIDNTDEYVRNTTARAFAVVASALGIPSLLPFLKAVCQSKKSWQARHTGIKIVQQISILMGSAVLPHLRNLVEIIDHGLNDEQQKVKTVTALAIAALAEASAPYGFESFGSVLKPLWEGVKNQRGKTLAAYLKSIGYVIPLMDVEYASYSIKSIMPTLIAQFQTPEDEMKKIVLKVVKQCVSTEGVEAAYIKEEVIPPFFKHFWVRRMALDRRNYKQLVETTVELANKVGVTEIVGRIVDDLRDESEPYRKMVIETVDQVITALGAAEIDTRLEKRLIDGILYAFQEQASDDSTAILNGFGTVVNSLGLRVRPYLQQIVTLVKLRLNNKLPKYRQQAADLITRIAVVMMNCNEEKLMGHLGVILYEYLGEEYPEVLGSILGALKAIVNVIGMTKMTPPIKDLLPRLTPILKNRQEKVQENCIDLVGRIADRGHEYVSAREWMRICFELLELLKAHKKAIRRAAVNTFGYIAKAVGPQDVLVTLLNNLRVQERQNRVCTTVAIAIVAETCLPFTVLPALMNEYRVPELNVQNGVLKALSFMFEYIGEMGKDYIYAVTPLLEDALMDRDPVHRQTACTVVKHMSLGVVGLGNEDAILHLLNFVWPNIFETSPHVINAVIEAIDGCRCAVGPASTMKYLLQGLFHPARKVRTIYWKLYNNLYIGNQDGLVPQYPRLPNDERNTFSRPELDIVL
jgi:splicing factor 3B subunit 1